MSSITIIHNKKLGLVRDSLAGREKILLTPTVLSYTRDVHKWGVSSKIGNERMGLHREGNESVAGKGVGNSADTIFWCGGRGLSNAAIRQRTMGRRFLWTFGR